MKNNTTFLDIGIDSMGFCVPHNTIRLEELAKARNMDPQKYKSGLFAHEMRIADCGEDIVSLSFNASISAISSGKISKDTIDAVLVGTETITYAVKSVASILKDLLGLKLEILTQDVYNACAAGTLAILNAIGLISAGIIKKALVVCTDISQYELESSGEPTQGAGAVALIISKNPRLAVFGSQFGKISSNINDFFRSAGKSTPDVFGKYSIDSYIALQTKAFNDFLSQTAFDLHRFDYFIFHAPYAKLPIKLIGPLLEEILLSDPDNKLLKSLLNFKIKLYQKEKEVLNEEIFEIGIDFISNQKLLQLLKQRIESSEIYSTESSEYKKEVNEIAIINLKDFIKQKILNPLQIPSLVGNMYSASVWAQLYHFLVSEAKSGQKIYFGSYGSGATCISGIIKVCENAEAYQKQHQTTKSILSNKRYIDYETYKFLRVCSDDGLIQSHFQKNYVWAKIQPYMNGFSENDEMITFEYCDNYCLLSKFQPIDYCPQNHTGHNSIRLPYLAKIIEIDKVREFDLANLNRGWVLVECIENGFDKRSILELSLVRFNQSTGIQNCYLNHQGVLNWIPVYRTLLLDTGSPIRCSEYSDIKGSDIELNVKNKEVDQIA